MPSCPNRFLNGRNLLIAAAAVFWLVTSLLCIKRAAKGSNDFDTFYAAGRAVWAGEELYPRGPIKLAGRVLYDPGGKSSFSKSGPFLYPPPAALFFAVFALLPLPAAAAAWNTLNVLCFAFGLRWTTQFLTGYGLRVAARPPPGDFILAAALLAAFFLDNLLMAQANLLVYALCAGTVLLWQKNKNTAAGCVLAAAVLLKAVPLVLAYYFLLKRQWKLLGGFALGLLLLGLIAPVTVFGGNEGLHAYRQWGSRMFAPLVETLRPEEKKEPVNLLDPSSKHLQGEEQTEMLFREMRKKTRIENLLNEKYQSLDAALTRLLLKDRNLYAESKWYPMGAVKRYLKMPVLAGGVNEAVLFKAIAGLQLLCFAVFTFALLGPARTVKTGEAAVSEIALVFLTMTLLPPYVRSHQFVHWTFAVIALLYFSGQGECRERKRSAILLRTAGALYLMQILPYGKAAGMGAWANLVLWAGFVLRSLRTQPKG